MYYHRFNQLARNAPRHLPRGACALEDLEIDLGTARIDQDFMTAVLGCSLPVLGTLAKLAPRPVPEMFAIFAIFAKFAIFDPALKYITLIHRQAPRSRSKTERAFSTPHPLARLTGRGGSERPAAAPIRPVRATLVPPSRSSNCGI